jgi:uncharacterized membrane protein YeaQ/YmgE (transglycosylase-associated protein family)
MTMFGWIVFGLIVGVVAKLLAPGLDRGGLILTIVLGIAGALLGGFIGHGLGWSREDDPVGFLMAVLGAILILVVCHKTGKSRDEPALGFSKDVGVGVWRVR